MRPIRRMLAVSTAFLALALGLLSAPATRAGEQADRAVAAVRRLVASGELRPDTVLRLRAKQGNVVSILGRDYALQQEWERKTGIAIDVGIMPQLDSLAFIRRSTDVDLTIARNHEFADLLHGGLITDLKPLLDRFGFRLSDAGPDGFLQLGQQSMSDGRVAAIPADFDVALLFLRRDLLEDPGQRARFRERHGRELRAPRTWQEYQELVAFFHRPAEGLYGTAESREPLTGWMYWLPRYLSSALPVQHLFDEKMRPLINSPAGVAATESYAATVAYSPPQALEDGKDYSYTLPFFVRGQAFSIILTAGVAKLANGSETPVRGRFMAAPIPGRLVGGQLVRRTQLIYGNNLVVPANAPNKALGLLFAMWLTDPENSTRSVLAQGITDPYRVSHLDDERIRAVYTPQVIDLIRSELPVMSPSGIGLPGDAEYIASLNRHIWQVAAGKLGAREAMERTAREWDQITDRIGRAAQIERWRVQRALYPATADGRP